MHRAKEHARRTAQPLRALIEEGLRRVLEAAEKDTSPRYRLVDCSVGQPGAPNPLERLSWQDLRTEIYGDT
ncbi:MAG: DUF2191 domain-containing protein [Polyangiales bacterium]